ncbi:MAG: putative multidrug efflux transporter MdtA [Methylococcaceae bacterium NSP1-2]|nr:MdtA/MuxA family multidrug efflux RND transporter periplasmic adaptor subunit [Methylococcaceae bacterium]OYV18322.1 MAG: putative multidrug efflux transporter MdtA [Methylococcaceae bacterium NSP1-2]
MKLEENKTQTFRWRTWLLLVLLAFSVAVYFIYPFDSKATQEVDKKADKKGKGMSSVTAEPVILADVPIYLNGLGTVTGLRTVTVRSRVDGELLRVLYKEGAMVKEGDLLAEIDPRNYQIQLMQVEGQLLRDEALLKNAELDADRYKTLLAQDSIAAQQVATQESLVKQYQGTVATDKALVANAKLQLSYTRITAPISGRLGLRLVDQGNIIKASDTAGLAVITQIQPISVVFTLPEDALPAVMPSLNTGKPLAVEAFDRSGKNKLAVGQLLAVDNQIDPSTGTVKLKSQFANTDGALFVNQFVNVRMLMETLHSVPIIPSSAVQNGEKGSFVYVLKDDQTVTVRPVKLGTVNGENVAVLEGLKAQELIVIDGTDKLREGAKVKRVTNEPIPENKGSKSNHGK